MLFSSPAFADDRITAEAARFQVQAQIELLPLGSMTAQLDEGGTLKTDSAVAYGVCGMVDYALTRYLRIGVAPRVIRNVTTANAPPQQHADSEIDLRLRVAGHYALVSGLEVYAAFAPGYTLVLSGDGGLSAYRGYALGGAVGISYQLLSRMFISGEVGYQRAFTRIEVVAGSGWEISYMHIGLGAGTRF